MKRIRVGMSPVFAIFLLAVGVGDLVLYATGGGGVQLLLAVVMCLGGISHLFGPLLIVDGDLVELKNPLGMTLRVLPFTALEIRGWKLLVTNAGVTRKVNGILANRAHWRALAQAIAAATPAATP